MFSFVVWNYSCSLRVHLIREKQTKLHYQVQALGNTAGLGSDRSLQHHLVVFSALCHLRNKLLCSLTTASRPSSLSRAKKLHLEERMVPTNPFQTRLQVVYCQSGRQPCYTWSRQLSSPNLFSVHSSHTHLMTYLEPSLCIKTNKPDLKLATL